MDAGTIGLHTRTKCPDPAMLAIRLLTRHGGPTVRGLT